MTLHLVERPGPTASSTSARDESHTWRELVTAVFAALGRPARSSSSTCQSSCAPNINTRPKLARSSPRHRLRRPTTPLADAVRDYVTRYLVPDKHLGDEPAGDASLAS